MRRLTIISVLVAGLSLAGGCDSGNESTGPDPIVFTPPPAASGAGFVALFAPPVDVGPYPTDLYNPTGGKLTVPVKVTTPLANALNTLDGFSTTAVITAPFNAPVDPASLVPFNPQIPATALTASIYVLERDAWRAARARAALHGARLERGRRRKPRRDRAADPPEPAHTLRVHHERQDPQHCSVSRPAPTSCSARFATRTSPASPPCRTNPR